METADCFLSFIKFMHAVALVHQLGQMCFLVSVCPVVYTTIPSSLFGLKYCVGVHPCLCGSMIENFNHNIVICMTSFLNYLINMGSHVSVCPVVYPPLCKQQTVCLI